MTLDALLEAWRTEAEQLRRLGCGEAADTTLTRAAELEAALSTRADTTLTLTEASRESGYSKRRLRQLLAEGELPNAGRKGRPRIRRADLPTKARRNGRGEAFDAAKEAAVILGRGRDH